MKRSTITMVAVAALVVGGTPAFADNKGHGKPSPAPSTSMSVGQAKQYEVELTGAVLTTNGTNSLTMKAKTASKPKALKTLASTILRAASLTVTTDTKTVVKRGGSRAFSSIKVNDKVNIRAKCTASPLSCVATRITATPGPAPKPSSAADKIGRAHV